MTESKLIAPPFVRNPKPHVCTDTQLINPPADLALAVQNRHVRKLTGSQLAQLELCIQPDTCSMTTLGRAYITDETSELHSKAAWCFTLGACAGCSRAQLDLAMMVMNETHGQRRDPVRIVHLLTESAKAGQNEAYYLLGRVYSGELPEYKDANQARACFAMAWRTNVIHSLMLFAFGKYSTEPLPEDDADRARETVEVLTSRAAKGELAARVKLGAFYLRGERGLTKDAKRAFALFDGVVREDGTNQAKMWLALAYAEPRFGQVDMKQVVRLLTETTDEYNKPSAYYALACLFRTGEKGLSHDPARARALMLHAAKDGLASAQLDLGHMYLKGEGGDRDRIAAYTWFEQAALRNEGDAKEQMEAMRVRGEAPPKHGGSVVTEQLLCTAESGTDSTASLALAYSHRSDPVSRLVWLRRAVEQGNIEAHTLLARILDRDLGDTKSLIEARALYTKAAESGDDEAQLSLAHMYDKGLGGPVDHDVAGKWLVRAAKQGNRVARAVLGKAGPELHTHVPKDERWERKVLTQAARAGDKTAIVALRERNPYAKPGGSDGPEYMYERGSEYEHGNIFTVENKELARIWYQAAAFCGHLGALDRCRKCGWNAGIGLVYEEVRRWYEEGASEGSEQARSQLGVMHARGIGGPVDAKKAVELWTIAATHGNVGAQTHLGRAYETGRGVHKDEGKAFLHYNKALDRGCMRAAYFVCRQLLARCHEKGMLARVYELRKQMSESDDPWVRSRVRVIDVALGRIKSREIVM